LKIINRYYYNRVRRIDIVLSFYRISTARKKDYLYNIAIHHRKEQIKYKINKIEIPSVREWWACFSSSSASMFVCTLALRNIFSTSPVSQIINLNPSHD